jgi:hypothetical protein
MISLDWKTHKRLLEAAGDSLNIYICSARGQNKTETERRLIEELQASGRTVVRMKDLYEARTMSSSVLDYDLLIPRHERTDSIIEALYDAINTLKKEPEYRPPYEMFNHWYVLDEDRQSTPYLHWMKTNRYLGYLTGNFEEV